MGQSRIVGLRIWRLSGTGGRKAGVLALAVGMLIAGETARAQGDSPATKPVPPSASTSKAAGASGETPKFDEIATRDALKALHQLGQAVRVRDQGDRSAAKAPLPQRPQRAVTPPTLTSAELDRLLTKYLEMNSPKVQTAELTSDVEFVRRVYFDVAGAPPEAAKVVAFVNDRSKDKRARLIDALLETPGYARNWARYWRDVVRFHSTNQNPLQIRYDALEDWLAEQFGKNAPWDEIAASLITATGRNDENGAVGFALAHEAKPVELAGEVSRIFMGVQIQCAQCHDHKTDSWKQVQFHEFASFFSGFRAKPFERGMPGQLPVFGVVAQGRPGYAMPDKDDPKKQTPIAPRFFLTSSGNQTPIPGNLGAIERRALAASYVTGQDNPWFARAYVNRVWHALMGEAFYGPIDDMGPERTAKAREVLEPLADQWQKGGYDVRWLFRTILNTHAYQRRIRSTYNPSGKTPFASNCPSRLRSDQILEALSQALGLPPDLNGNREGKAGATGTQSPGTQTTLTGFVANAKKMAQASGLAGAPAAAKGQGKLVRLVGPRVLFNAVFGTDPSVPNDEVMGTIPQALFLMNGPIVHNRTLARPGTVLGEILTTAPNDRAALDALYIRVLSRQPTPKEVETCGSYLSSVGNRNEAFEDIFWSLINSTEFLSRR